jgi:uncharacterized protein YycO
MRIALFRSGSWVSRGIRWFTRGTYSHAALVTDAGTVWESRERTKTWKGGVRKLASLAEAADPGDVVHVFEVETSAEEDAEILKFAQSQEGHGYDYWGLVRFLDRRSDEADEKAGTWFCSEFVHAAFRAAGIELFERTFDWEVAPDLLKRCVYLEESNR